MSVRLTTLPNGFRVVTDTIPHVETAALGIWVECGGRHESPAEHGLSHLLEHMAFKGTDRRTARDIAEEIEAVGGSLNAYTGRDQTAYHARVLAEDVPLSVDILGDILQNSLYDPIELERERDVILQEIGQVEDTPDDLVFDALNEAAFPDQACGRSILGTPDTVRGFQRNDIARYLSRHYHGPAMMLVAAGAVDHERLVELAGAAFGEVQSGAPSAPEPAVFRGGRYMMRRALEQSHIALAFEGVSYSDPDYYTSLVFSTVYGGGMSSRLFQSVREERGLAYSVFSFAGSLIETGVVGVYLGTGHERLVEAVDVTTAELEGVADSASEDEVARARAQMKASLLMGRESVMNRCEMLARQISVYGHEIGPAELVTQIDAIDAAAVRAFARRLLDGPSPALAAIGEVDSLENWGNLRAVSTV